MSKRVTVLCPKCKMTTTIKIGITKAGTGVGSCYNCKKSVHIQLNNRGDVIRVK